MVRRVCRELGTQKEILVINDERTVIAIAPGRQRVGCVAAP